MSPIEKAILEKIVCLWPGFEVRNPQKDTETEQKEKPLREHPPGQALGAPSGLQGPGEGDKPQPKQVGKQSRAPRCADCTQFIPTEQLH